MCGNVPHCLMAVSVQRFAEAAQRAVGVRADCNAVKMCTQTVMSNVQSKFCNCLSSDQSGILAISCFHGLWDNFASSLCRYALLEMLADGSVLLISSKENLSVVTCCIHHENMK